MQQSGVAFARTLVGAASALICVPLLMLPFAPTLAFCVGLFGLYTLVTAGGFTALVAAMQETVPTNFRGRAMAWQGFLCTTIGMGAGPYAVAWMSDHMSTDGTGLRLALALITIPMMACTTALLAIVLLKQRSGRFLHRELSDVVPGQPSHSGVAGP